MVSFLCPKVTIIRGYEESILSLFRSVNFKKRNVCENLMNEMRAKYERNQDSYLH